MGRWYPPPAHRRIIEPFAGGAGYAIRYADHDVLLNDADEIVCGVWDYLIRASEAEIMSLPLLAPGDHLDDFAIPTEAKHLIGMWVEYGMRRPRMQAPKWMDTAQADGKWSASIRAKVARQVQWIRHWRIRHGSYLDLDMDPQATWFVDPPYIGAGSKYRYGKRGIDFGQLAAWCLALEGQVIVCEAAGADWLPFRRLARMQGGFRGSYDEAIWIKPGGGNAGPVFTGIEHRAMDR